LVTIFYNQLSYKSATIGNCLELSWRKWNYYC